MSKVKEMKKKIRFRIEYSIILKTVKFDKKFLENEKFERKLKILYSRI